MRDVTVPWSYLMKVPTPPIGVRLRDTLEPAILLVLMLVPLLLPLLTPALFLRVTVALILLCAPFSVPFMVMAVTGKGVRHGPPVATSTAGRMPT